MNGKKSKRAILHPPLSLKYIIVVVDVVEGREKFSEFSIKLNIVFLAYFKLVACAAKYVGLYIPWNVH
jgi:hypothetical protein